MVMLYFSYKLSQKIVMSFSDVTITHTNSLGRETHCKFLIFKLSNLLIF